MENVAVRLIFYFFISLVKLLAQDISRGVLYNDIDYRAAITISSSFAILTTSGNGQVRF